ncbi:hypothetical protein FZC33_18085 [Labrys sp. KNU-23]|uniref:hypothetical protein n=1 Tax=Labrys sp. KNU-23 TaxID=2789216 RepID=UPI0011EFC94E|nr:hypothetical protein [Labrys sp. KNU-23]QEN88089.1 hypothetical protein FZC33_18085 [Labrys sp. KNU-23]
MRTLLIRPLPVLVTLVVIAGWMAPKQGILDRASGSIKGDLPGGVQTGTGEFDVGTVTAVRVTGPAGLVRLSASRGGPYRAELRSRPEGWFGFWRSNWSAGGCANAGSIRLVGTQLQVDTGNRAWFGASDCRLELDASLPEGVAVSIEQDATSSQLSGNFASLDVDSRAGDIALDGHARTVSIEGNAIRARLSYARVDQDESITLGGNAIDAELRFAGAEAVNYAVSGHASLVDSTLPNKPGVRPAIAIKGNFLRVRIGGE